MKLAKHLVCGWAVTWQKRQIVPLPCDRDWPRDIEITVAWCDQCRCIVEPAELGEVPS